MTITEKLDESWDRKKQSEAVFGVRALLENCHKVITETIARVDEIVQSGEFSTVDADIKQEGQIIRQTLNDAKTVLDAHLAFLYWRQ